LVSYYWNLSFLFFFSLLILQTILYVSVIDNRVFSYYYLLYLSPLLSIVPLSSLPQYSNTHNTQIAILILLNQCKTPGHSLHSQSLLPNNFSGETDKGSRCFWLVHILDLLLNCYPYYCSSFCVYNRK
jgi:hypothetical protein